MGAHGRIRRRRGLSRRDFLKRATAAASLPLWLNACNDSNNPHGVVGDTPFKHGIASGDPLSDRVILWTRITPRGGETMIGGNVAVYSDPGLTTLHDRRDFTAVAASDWTVKIDFDGLAPGTTYYYRFEALGVQSATGRTRTAPVGGVDRLRFGIASCASYAHGYFDSYRLLAQRADLDAVLFLGDYIYEYGNGEYGDLRDYEPPHEILTLSDYRTRHAFYKRDADLMELHRQHPMIAVWDDHESADNSWRDGAANHSTDGSEGVWAQRKLWAEQAYCEWMPIRLPQTGNVGKIWRRFSYGDLADVFMLDTRLDDRDEPTGLNGNDPDTGAIPDNPVVAAEPSRRIISPEQLQWLKDGLRGSSAKWKVIGQQVVMHQWNIVGLPQPLGGAQINGDAWDGYQAQRAELFQFLSDNSIGNVVVVSGDVHSSWAADLTPDPSNPLVYNPLTGSGTVGVEFVGPSVTSPFLDLPLGQDAILLDNPHIRYSEWTSHGYLLLDLDATRAQGEYWYLDTVTEPRGAESFATAYQTADGADHLQLQAVGTPSDPKPDADPLAS